MSDLDLAFLSIAELGARYAEGSLSPVDIADLHLRRIERLDPHLRAFQLVDAEGARSAALASNARWRTGSPLGPLDGIPVTIKDNVDWKGLPTRHGSLNTPDTPAEADSPVVARLREAGCILLGKTTLPEFGWKGVTDSKLLGAPTRNPWDLARSPGGSTGGGAAAVAAGIGTIAFGNDGGGSIRGPGGTVRRVRHQADLRPGATPPAGRLLRHHRRRRPAGAVGDRCRGDPGRDGAAGRSRLVRSAAAAARTGSPGCIRAWPACASPTRRTWAGRSRIRRCGPWWRPRSTGCGPPAR